MACIIKLARHNDYTVQFSWDEIIDYIGNAWIIRFKLLMKKISQNFVEIREY